MKKVFELLIPFWMQVSIIKTTMLLNNWGLSTFLQLEIAIADLKHIACLF